MKKAKILLTAITVLAIVGGAFAFKAAKFNAQLYCTAPSTTTACIAGMPVAPTYTFTTTVVPQQTIHYTTTTNLVNDCDVLDCSQIGKTKVDLQ